MERPVEDIAHVILSYLSHTDSILPRDGGKGAEMETETAADFESESSAAIYKTIQGIANIEALSDAFSIKRAILLIVESLLRQPDTRLHQHAVKHLCPLHLELLEAVKAYILSSKRPTSSPHASSLSTSRSSSDVSTSGSISMKMIAGTTLLLATIAKSVPHLRGSVEEVRDQL